MISADALDREILQNHSPTEFSRLWTVALATYGVGDIVTTIALLNFVERVDEANVLLQSVVTSHGQAGLVGLKFAVFLVGITTSVYGDRVDDWVIYYLPPTVLAVFGAFATAFNLRLFFG